MSNDIERVTKMAGECGAISTTKYRLDVSGTALVMYPEELLAFEQMAVKEKDEEIARLKGLLANLVKDVISNGYHNSDTSLKAAMKHLRDLDADKAYTQPQGEIK